MTDILVVDDDPSLREVVRYALAREGWTVREAGDGSAANQEHLFDRFFTTARTTGGTGLGLALARTVVETHGGTLTVSSKPADTAFTVRLPVQAT